MNVNVLRLGILNNSPLRYSVLNGLLALILLVAAAVGVQAVMKHHATFQSHYFMWGMLGVTVLFVCIGWALIFMDEAVLKDKGQIQLSDESFEIGDDRFLLNMVRKVAVVVKVNRGPKQGNKQQPTGTENSLVFYTTQQQTITCEVLLKTNGERETLEHILHIWGAQGVKLTTEDDDLEAQ